MLDLAKLDPGAEGHGWSKLDYALRIEKTSKRNRGSGNALRGTEIAQNNLLAFTSTGEMHI
jgi:hypothetical protein